MPNLANAKKALRQSIAKSKKNKVIKDELHSMKRAFKKHLDAKELKEAEEMLPKLQKSLDKMVTKNIIKKNTAARTMSRLHVAFHKVK